MIKGLLGKKIGMTQTFRENGDLAPVTVLQVGPCIVTQIRTLEKDGYEAVQIGFGEAKRLNRPLRGHLKNGPLLRHLREVPFDTTQDLQVGQGIGVTLFEPGDLVNVIGTTKGRGFQGVVKRHGFAGGPRTHGQSDRLRAPGAIGAGTFPGRVVKGKRMPGHMGNVRVTVKNLEVVQVDQERNLLMLKGGVPGAPNGLVLVHKVSSSDKN